ncbi:MAG TPA: hypothetical protein VHR41_02065 [Gemmatimonadales bacterium]|jgi:hypothetical protein|nr:hypothetical protein [Gemmatimonadales bacterium]
MSQEAVRPKPPTTPISAKKALLDAYDTVLKTQADEREAELRAIEARRQARRWSRPLVLICAAIVLFTGAYLWIERPDWVFPRPPAPESAAVAEAGLRITIANAAQHVERFRQRTGRLPESLEAAGAHPLGLRYSVSGAGYRLEGERDGRVVTFASDEPLLAFLGNSFQVISRRDQ